MKRILYFSLTIAIMAAIFCFSSQPAEESTEVSRGFVYSLFKMIPFVHFSDETLIKIVDSLNYIARKFAHFSIYGALGAASFLSASTYDAPLKKRWLWCLVLCFAYAVSDELHQYFVPGRSCELRDVCIDFAGSNLGVYIIYKAGSIAAKLQSKYRKKA